MTDHDTSVKPQLAGTNRGTRPRWSEEIRPAGTAAGKSERDNDMTNTRDKHQADVKAQIGQPYLWHVVCNLCPWLQDSEGPWVDSKVAQRRAKAHSTDPDIERKAAEYADLWADPNYDAMNDEELAEHIDLWFTRNHEYARQRDETKDSGEGQRLGSWAGRAHVRATQGIREQRRRENAILKARETQDNSQCERNEGGQA